MILQETPLDLHQRKWFCYDFCFHQVLLAVCYHLCHFVGCKKYVTKTLLVKTKFCQTYHTCVEEIMKNYILWKPLKFIVIYYLQQFLLKFLCFNMKQQPVVFCCLFSFKALHFYENYDDKIVMNS